MMTEIEYLEFLLSNRIHPEYSLRDIRREIEDRIRTLKNAKSTKEAPIIHDGICGETCSNCDDIHSQNKELMDKDYDKY